MLSVLVIQLDILSSVAVVLYRFFGILYHACEIKMQRLIYKRRKHSSKCCLLLPTIYPATLSIQLKLSVLI